MFYPSKPALPSPIDPTTCLSKNLLRIVFGDVRHGGPLISLSKSTSSSVNDNGIKLKLKGGENRQEYVVTVKDGDDKPDYWFDFVGDNLEDLMLSVHVDVGSQSGRAVILGGEWKNYKGVVKRAVVDTEGNVVGVVVLDYVVMKPFDYNRLGEGGVILKETEAVINGDRQICEEGDGKKGNGECSNEKASPIFAGHRGVGTNTSTFVQENTLLSFVMATRGPLVKNVELDIQLTKDGHPVVYHDYFVGKDKHGRGGTPIYSLTLQEWKDLVKKKVQSDETGYDSDHGGKHKTQKRPTKSGKSTSDVVETILKGKSKSLSKAWDDDYDMDGLKGKLRDELPTLKRICRKVPKDVGLLVEIKYPPVETAEEENIPYPEKNLLVDETLYRIFKEEQYGGRPIMFLTFDPDVAAMTRLKQHVYPVYYLNSESREEDTDLLDPRCTSIDGANNFAKSQKFEGLVLLADILLENESLVERIHSTGLKLMTYGRVNMNPEKTCRQIELGVDGIIADNVGVVARECSKCVPMRAKSPQPNGSDTSDAGLGESIYSLVTSSEDGEIDNE